jgi:hypothetical protein
MKQPWSRWVPARMASWLHSMNSMERRQRPILVERSEHPPADFVLDSEPGWIQYPPDIKPDAWTKSS